VQISLLSYNINVYIFIDKLLRYCEVRSSGERKMKMKQQRKAAKKAAKKAKEPARQTEVRLKAVNAGISDGTRMYAVCSCPANLGELQNELRYVY
jgi:hypothetical protein